MTERPQSHAQLNKQTVLEHFDAKIQLDSATLGRQMTSDIVWWVPRSASRLGTPRPLTGRDAVVRMLTTVPLFQPEGRRWDIHHVVADEELAVAHASLSATTRSGVAYENDYAFVFHFRDGLIDAIWEHLDTAYAYERLDAKRGRVT